MASLEMLMVWEVAKRLAVALVLLVALLVITKKRKSGKSTRKNFLISMCCFVALGLILYFFPYSFTKAWKVKSPSDTFEKRYTYDSGNMVTESGIDLFFKSRSSPDEVLAYLYDTLRENGLCVGQQSLQFDERCYSKIRAAQELFSGGSFTINTSSARVSNLSEGLAWGFVHYIRKDSEGNTAVRISLYDRSR